MPYRNKIYTAFDGDHDIRYYRILQAWRDNDRIDFGYLDAHDLNYARDTSQTESIRTQLRLRMQNSRLMLLLVGENTRFLTRFLAWEVDYAHKIGLPIVVSNLNKIRVYDPSRCPSSVTDGDVYTVHISFERSIIKHAIDHFPSEYQERKLRSGAKRHYSTSVYARLGL